MAIPLRHLATAPPVPSGALALGLLGVCLFALSLPMTRLAVGPVTQPALSPAFVAFGRAAFAGLLAGVWLLAHKAPMPSGRGWAPLAAVAGGVVFGFPLLTALALRRVGAVHASLILAVLPLFTALIGARLARQRPSIGFWLCAMAGAGLVASYTVLRTGVALQGHLADGLLVLAMLAAAVGYALGGRMSQTRPAGEVIGWALVLSLPVTLPVMVVMVPEATSTKLFVVTCTVLARVMVAVVSSVPPLKTRVPVPMLAAEAMDSVPPLKTVLPV